MITLTDEYLKKLHEVETEMLAEVDRICRKYDIPYYMIGGTLLGAVRHKGFIPWDDDMDIVMPRRDFARFLKACDEDLSDEYHIVCAETVKNYWYTIPKICKKNTAFKSVQYENIDDNMEIYVDIFMLDDVPVQDSPKQARTAKYANVLQAIMTNRGCHFNTDKMSTGAKLLYAVTRPLSIGTIGKIREKMITKYPESCKYYTNLSSRYGRIKQTALKEKYYPAVELEFEGKSFLAPKEYEYILERIYGDYMQLPPVESRCTTHKLLELDFGDGTEVK